MVQQLAAANIASVAPEIVAAVIAGALTVGTAAWQTIKTIRSQAQIAAEASRDQARLEAGTALLPLRKEAYRELWKLLDVGPRETPKNLADASDRNRRADAMTKWYYPHGLLLADGAQRQWRACRDALRRPGELDHAAQVEI